MKLCLKVNHTAISGKGYIEDLDTIDRVGLYEHYKNILKTSPIEIMIEGEFDETEVVELIKERFHLIEEI